MKVMDYAHLADDAVSDGERVPVEVTVGYVANRLGMPAPRINYFVGPEDVRFRAAPRTFKFETFLLGFHLREHAPWDVFVRLGAPVGERRTAVDLVRATAHEARHFWQTRAGMRDIGTIREDDAQRFADRIVAELAPPGHWLWHVPDPVYQEKHP